MTKLWSSENAYDPKAYISLDNADYENMYGPYLVVDHDGEVHCQIGDRRDFAPDRGKLCAPMPWGLEPAKVVSGVIDTKSELHKEIMALFQVYSATSDDDAKESQRYTFYDYIGDCLLTVTRYDDQYDNALEFRRPEDYFDSDFSMRVTQDMSIKQIEALAEEHIEEALHNDIVLDKMGVIGYLRDHQLDCETSQAPDLGTEIDIP